MRRSGLFVRYLESGVSDGMGLYCMALASGIGIRSERSWGLGNSGLSEHPTIVTAIRHVQKGPWHLTRSHREILIVVCTIHVH